jgi:penicillin-binding protein 1C
VRLLVRRRPQGRLRRALRAALGLALAPLLWLVIGAALTPLPAELATRSYGQSVVFTDRSGAILREVRADDATRASWVPLAELGPHLPRAIVAAEDGRFRQHPGVDPLAIVRAVVASARAGRVVSGASTLTMQLARVVRPHPRTVRGKLGEMALAVRIERSLDKDRILEEYANRAPFGPGIRGVGAAARLYFDKAPAHLSLAEAATLAALPRGPSLYDPRRHADRLLRRRDRVLGRMLATGAIDRAAYDRAIAEPLTLAEPRGSFGAPHLVQALWDGTLPGGRAVGAPSARVETTIDRDVQRAAETALGAALAPLGERHVRQGAVVVVENETGAVLAYVGSADFHGAADGQNDGVRARRQPGSTLKPFVYGAALELGLVDAATPLEDVPLVVPGEGGTWAPQNYDRRFHGPVRVREALANSLNVPAVRVLRAVGQEAALERLRAFGFASLREDARVYGDGLVLGDGEVSLLELARAYAAIARRGTLPTLRFTKAAAPGPDAPRVLREDVADLLADVLADRHARIASFGEGSVLELPFPVAAKTGTSKGFRDNWTVGFTREITVAVWVGNFDGSPMREVSGITGAGPVFRAVMLAAMRGRTPAPLGVTEGGAFVHAHVCPLSGGRPTDACPHAVVEWLPPNVAAARAACTMHERVPIDPRNGLRAGPGCGPAHRELRSYERFEGSLAAWAQTTARPLAPSAWSPACPGGPAPASEIRIGYPSSGERYFIDPKLPREAQILRVRVEGPLPSRVVLRVDGRIVGSAVLPHPVPWRLEPGEHELVAEVEGQRSAPVRLRVD